MVAVPLVPEVGPLVLVAVRAPFLEQVPLPQVAVAVAVVPVAVAPVAVDVAHRSERVVVVATAKSSSQ